MSDMLNDMLTFPPIVQKKKKKTKPKCCNDVSVESENREHCTMLRSAAIPDVSAYF